MPEPRISVPPYVTGSAKQQYRDLVEELGDPPREEWRVMKLAGLAKLQDKRNRGKADDIELMLIERERRLLGLPHD